MPSLVMPAPVSSSQTAPREKTSRRSQILLSCSLSELAQIIDIPRRAAARSAAKICARVPTSTPCVGSSSSSRRGPRFIQRAISTFCALPPESAAGLDGIELEAYGHLLDHFLSPLTSTPDGPYNGAVENRMRFIFEVLGAIRKRVGQAFIVGVRYTADEDLAGGNAKAEGLEISQRLKESGLTDVIPVQGMANAPHLDFAGEIRAATKLPTFHAAKIPDVATARYAVESGKVDMVGMTRAHMADPHIVREIVERREDDIRPCVGATYCLDRIYQGGAACCIHNPATGRELTMPHVIPKATSRRKVVLVELAGDPGGQIRLTARSPRRHERIGIVGWRVAQCGRLGVTFRFNTWAEADTVLAETPDVVIVATGGIARTEVLSAGNDLVVSSRDIIAGDAKPGSDVLVYDGAGDHAGLQAAEIVARIEIMMPDRAFAPEVMGMNLVSCMRSLQKLDATFTVTYRLEAVRRDGNRLLAVIGATTAACGRSVPSTRLS